MKTTGWASLLAAGGLALAGSISANAADLGGDCCADLEERVAELEATTARKGNRKVSLEVSGHVNEAVMWWDDGEESNVYVVGNDSGRSRFRFKGKAKIDKDWEAGYLIEIGVRSQRSDRVDQGPPAGPAGGDVVGARPGSTLDIRHSAWYIKSKTYGTVWVGQTNTATESITEINHTQTADIAKNSDTEDHIAGFQLRRSGIAGSAGLSAQEWRRLVKDDFIQPGEGSRDQTVLYVSPEFAGFTASASWGGDDHWGVALRYKAEFNGIELAAGIGYGQNSEEDNGVPHCLYNGPAGADCHQYGGSINVIHEPTGLFLTFGAGVFVDDNIDQTAAFAAINPEEEHKFYAFQAGVERKWFELGKTTIYGEYFHHDGGANDRSINIADPLVAGFAFNGNSFFTDTKVETIGGGVIQGIDKAAMRIYLIYRHYEGEATIYNPATNSFASPGLEDVDVVLGGALIKF